MSARLRPRSRASDDTDRGWPPSSVNKSLRNVMDVICSRRRETAFDVCQKGRPCGWPSSCHATKHFMLAKMSAAWLVVLVLSPVSAPFSTCDLLTLFHVEVPDGGDPTRP